MSRKTTASRFAPSVRAGSATHFDVRDVPRCKKPLTLICGVCGASGRYKVGTVLLNPMKAKASKAEDIADAVGFTGYFRCRKCDAGGPWKLPVETTAYLTMMLMLSVDGAEDVPLIPGCIATFDKRTFRYATEGEAHLKQLIDREPQRAFLWVRLGNLYSHASVHDRAEKAYRRALELDPEDIEAHAMLGDLLVETGRRLEAVPNWHAVLRNVREAHQLNKDLRRNLARRAIEQLLAAHAESKGQIDLLPTVDPEEYAKHRADGPEVVELREFDLGSEAGIEELCGMFVEPPRRRDRGLFRRPRRRVAEASDEYVAAPLRRTAVAPGRNDPCPCGSGHKYKKCCGR